MMRLWWWWIGRRGAEPPVWPAICRTSVIGPTEPVHSVSAVEAIHSVIDGSTVHTVILTCE